MAKRHIMSIVVIVIALGSVLGSHSITLAAENGVPRTFLLNLDKIRITRQALLDEDETQQPVIIKLFNDAESALTRGPFSVVFDDRIPPSGDKHDYFEISPHFWPNPDTPDGLPWVRRDGTFNSDNLLDGGPLDRLSLDVKILALAYFLSGDETYAQHIAFLLRAWFLDEATSMNPNMTYGKVNPNTLAGGFPVARATLKFAHIIDAAGLLEGSPFWSIQDEQALQQWAADFVNWMETHRVALHEQRAENNHGTYYDLLEALLSIYSREEESLRSSLIRFQGRIATQIAPDGSQPIEMERSSNLFYHTFNLNGALSLARLSEHVSDIDLFHYTTEAGASIPKALAFLAPYATEEEKWPFFSDKQKRTKPVTQFRLYRQAASIYNSADYSHIAQSVPGDFETERVLLAYPITHILLTE